MRQINQSRIGRLGHVFRPSHVSHHVHNLPTGQLFYQIQFQMPKSASIILVRSMFFTKYYLDFRHHYLVSFLLSG